MSSNDITINGLEACKKADEIYLDSYTSKLSSGNISDLEKLIGKKIIIAARTMLEDNSAALLDKAKKKNIAILIIGSPTAATTHISLFKEAEENNIEVGIIENSSILTAVGITGLQLYNFGQTTTIPFNNKNITTPIEVLKKNQKLDLHTLFLLDIHEDKLMSAREGLDYLIKNGLDKNTEVIACGALGSQKYEIKVGKASEISLTKFPQCFIIPGKLHFLEQEMLEFWKRSH